MKKQKKFIGDKYDYSKVDLDKRNEYGKVCIICPTHGEFWQKPSNHLYGQGCSKCKNNKLSIERSFNKEQFIKKAKEIHRG